MPWEDSQPLIPGSLATFYRLYGGTSGLLTTYLRMTPPQQLDFTTEDVVFCRDHQMLPCWAVKKTDLSLDDPSVYERTTRQGAFRLYSSSLGTFLNSAMCWQCLHLQPIQGECPESFHEKLRAVGTYFEAECGAGTAEQQPMLTAYGEGMIACSFPSTETTYFGFADEEGHTSTENRLGVRIPVNRGA
jgi:hypothetical protein